MCEWAQELNAPTARALGYPRCCGRASRSAWFGSSARRRPPGRAAGDLVQQGVVVQHQRRPHGAIKPVGALFQRPAGAVGLGVMDIQRTGVPSLLERDMLFVEVPDEAFAGRYGPISSQPLGSMAPGGSGVKAIATRARRPAESPVVARGRGGGRRQHQHDQMATRNHTS